MVAGRVVAILFVLTILFLMSALGFLLLSYAIHLGQC